MHKENFRLLPKHPQYFKEEIIGDLIDIYINKPNIEYILSFLINPEIINMKVIETMEAVSEEGLRLTNTTLMVYVKLKKKLTYAGENKNGSVHSSYYESYKTLPIILPEELDGKDVHDLVKCNRLKITPYISANHSRIFNKRQIFNCCLLLLDVKFCT